MFKPNRQFCQYYALISWTVPLRSKKCSTWQPALQFILKVFCCKSFFTNVLTTSSCSFYCYNFTDDENQNIWIPKSLTMVKISQLWHSLPIYRKGGRRGGVEEHFMEFLWNVSVLNSDDHSITLRAANTCYHLVVVQKVWTSQVLSIYEITPYWLLYK